MMKLQDIKRELRAGRFTSVGCYPKFFVTTNGDALSFAVVREEWRQVCQAHICKGWEHSGWAIAAVDINWENGELACDHTGERIESAYVD